MELLRDSEDLIKALKIDDMGFTVKRSFWEKYINSNNPELKEISNKIFGNEQSVWITKKMCFDKCKKLENTAEFILLVIYWGFSHPGTQDFRKNSFPEITDKENFNNIKSWLDSLRQKGSITEFVSDIESKLNLFKGMRPSTLTKLLYFLEVPLNNLRCLIIDSTIMKSFKKYQELEDLDGMSFRDYPRYLERLEKVSKTLNVEPDKLEAFLYLNG